MQPYMRNASSTDIMREKQKKNKDINIKMEYEHPAITHPSWNVKRTRHLKNQEYENYLKKADLTT
jgi:hypothetical protein